MRYNIVFSRNRPQARTAKSLRVNHPYIIIQYIIIPFIPNCCCCCCFLTLTDPLRIQPWSQDRRNQTKPNRESEMSMESTRHGDGRATYRYLFWIMLKTSLLVALSAFLQIFISNLLRTSFLMFLHTDAMLLLLLLLFSHIN